MNYIYTHNLDPMIFTLKLGSFSLSPRWYAMMYLLGFVTAYFILKKFTKEKNIPLTPDDIMDFLTYLMLGVILGGRLGYVLFYNLQLYLQNPFEIIAIWHGGMSFHGGALGVIFATLLYVRKKKIPFWTFADICALATPPGLFFGRIGNFINAELWGKPTDGTWGVIFPGEYAGGIPRHPTQLYESFLEGLCLFILIYCLTRFAKLKPGTLVGVFLMGYGIGRSIVEFYRLPDAHIGYIGVEILGGEWLTMGHILCLPMILGGLAIIIWSNTRKWPVLSQPQSVPQAAAPASSPDEVSPFTQRQAIPDVPANEQPQPNQFYQDDQYHQQSDHYQGQDNQYDQHQYPPQGYYQAEDGQYYPYDQNQSNQYPPQGYYQAEDGQYYPQQPYQDSQYNPQGYYQGEDGQYYPQDESPPPPRR